MTSSMSIAATQSPEIVWSTTTSSYDLVFLTALFAKCRLPKAFVLLENKSSSLGVVSARNNAWPKDID